MTPEQFDTLMQVIQIVSFLFAGFMGFMAG